MLIKRQVILAKIEATFGVDPTPVAANDSVLAENLAPAFEGARRHEREPTKPSLGSIPSVYGGTLKTISFDVYLKGSGTAGTAPEIDPLLRACGMGVTNVPATSDTYAPVSTAYEGCTIYWYEDGLEHKLIGCRGSFVATLEAGVPGKLSFTMTGHYTKPTDVALVTPTYDATVPPSVINLANFLLDSVAFNVAAISLDMGVVLAMPADILAADGYGDVTIVDRKVTGSIDPLATLIATYDWVTKWQADTSVALTTGAVGGTAGNKWTLACPTAQYTEPAQGDRDGIITRQVTFAANESSGDDEMSLAFT